jgi:hypothetical protein
MLSETALKYFHKELITARQIFMLQLHSSHQGNRCNNLENSVAKSPTNLRLEAKLKPSLVLKTIWIDTYLVGWEGIPWLLSQSTYATRHFEHSLKKMQVYICLADSYLSGIRYEGVNSDARNEQARRPTAVLRQQYDTRHRRSENEA